MKISFWNGARVGEDTKTTTTKKWDFQLNANSMIKLKRRVARYGDFSNKSIKQILQIRRHNAVKTFVFHIATASAMDYMSTVLYCIMCYMIARFMRCQFRDTEWKRRMKRERMNARSNESQCFLWTNAFERLKSLHAPYSMIERWT